MAKLLRRLEASKYLREAHGVVRAPATLAKLAVSGDGPTFRRDGKVPLYSTDDLDGWVASILSPPMRSTTQTTSEQLDAAGVCLPRPHCP
jgi:hypothetical protein